MLTHAGNLQFHGNFSAPTLQNQTPKSRACSAPAAAQGRDAAGKDTGVLLPWWDQGAPSWAPRATVRHHSHPASIPMPSALLCTCARPQGGFHLPEGSDRSRVVGRAPRSPHAAAGGGQERQQAGSAAAWSSMAQVRAQVAAARGREPRIDQRYPAKEAEQDETAEGTAHPAPGARRGLLRPIRPIPQSATSDGRKIILKLLWKQITPGRARRGPTAEHARQQRGSDGEAICARQKVRKFPVNLINKLTLAGTLLPCATLRRGVEKEIFLLAPFVSAHREQGTAAARAMCGEPLPLTPTVPARQVGDKGGFCHLTQPREPHSLPPAAPSLRAPSPAPAETPPGLRSRAVRAGRPLGSGWGHVMARGARDHRLPSVFFSLVYDRRLS